jgi:hypothetical protein
VPNADFFLHGLCVSFHGCSIVASSEVPCFPTSMQLEYLVVLFSSSSALNLLQDVVYC